MNIEKLKDHFENIRLDANEVVGTQPDGDLRKIVKAHLKNIKKSVNKIEKQLNK
jgi:hypothetical protein